MKKLLKENYKLYIAIFFVILAFFGMFIIKNNGVAIFDGDTFEQMYKFYCGGWEKVHSGTFSMWDYSLGTGGSIFSYSLYWLTSPIFLLCLLFPKSFIPHVMFIGMVIEYILAFIFTHFWASRLTTNKKAQLIGAFIFTFCGWALAYTRFEWLLISSVMYPLILYFTEMYLSDKKIIGLCISVGILGIINYYLLYQFIPFLCLYALFRYLIINKEHLKIKTVLLEALKYFGLVFVGIMLSGVILIPAGYLVLNTPRFVGDATATSIFDHYSLKAIYKVITSLFTPVFRRQNVNFFMNAELHEFIGWGGGASLYSLIITPILLPLLIKVKDKFKRNCYLTFLGLLCIFLFFTSFSHLFQATIDTRWYYMFVLLNSMIAMEVITNLEEGIINKKFVIYSSTVVIVLILLFLFISNHFYFADYEMFSDLLISSVVIIVFCIVYALVLYKGYKQTILIIVLSMEVIYSGFIFYEHNKPLPSYIFSELNQNEAIEWLNNHDDSFYRVLYDDRYEYLDKTEEFSLTSPNDPLAYGFMGFTFYTSLYNTNQQEFLNRSATRCYNPQLIGRDKIYNTLSSKYYITYDNINPIPYGYQKIEENDLFSVYENKNYVELGFTYSKDKVINKSVLEGLDIYPQNQILLEYLVTEDSQNTDYMLQNEPELLITFADEPIRVLEFEEPVNNVELTVEQFGMPHVDITAYYKDNIVQHYSFWQYNYENIYIDSPIDTLVIEGEDTYGYGTMINVYSSPIDGSYDTYFKDLTKNSFTNVKYSNDYIEGDITIDNSDDTVFTSIAYDEGWSVYANGKKIDFKKVQLGFIGFNLEAGTYHIEFKYETPYLKTGIMVSLAGIFILLSILYINKKRAK